MKTFKLIVIILGAIINLGFYVTFFMTFTDKSVNETTSLLILIVAMIMTILLKQELKNN